MAERRATYSYTTGDQRVSLTDSDWVAIDRNTGRKFLTTSDLAAIDADGESLRGSLVLVPRSLLDPAVLRQLDDAGGVQPVLQSDDGTLMIALPEVRVEIDTTDDDSLSQAEALIRSTVDELDGEIVRHSGQRIVIEPKSHRGHDALAIASRISELLPDAVSQPRFLRRVARPGVRKTLSE